jgi:hypothetical protein
MGKIKQPSKSVMVRSHKKMKMCCKLLGLCTVSFGLLLLSLPLAKASALPSDTLEDDGALPSSTSSKASATELDAEEITNNATETTLPQNLFDEIEDSFFDALSRDPSCGDEDCWAPPESTVETTPSDGESEENEASCSSDPTKKTEASDGTINQASDDKGQQTCSPVVDKHWGSDPNILRMRDKLREAGSLASSSSIQDTSSNQPGRKSMIPKNKRPPVFLIPGLASTRLIAWKYKSCPQHPLVSDIKVLDIAWLNINFVFQMGTFDSSCLVECLSLGLNQTDTDDLAKGCKLRPEEGLDAISSLSPGGLGSELLVGGTNTGE